MADNTADRSTSTWPSSLTERAAKRLHREMSHLDPHPNDACWEQLREWDRHFFYHCAEAVLNEAGIDPVANTT